MSNSITSDEAEAYAEIRELPVEEFHYASSRGHSQSPPETAYELLRAYVGGYLSHRLSNYTLALLGKRNLMEIANKMLSEQDDLGERLTIINSPEEADISLEFGSIYIQSASELSEEVEDVITAFQDNGEDIDQRGARAFIVAHEIVFSATEAEFKNHIVQVLNKIVSDPEEELHSSLGDHSILRDEDKL